MAAIVTMARMDILKDYAKENQRISVRKHSSIEIGHQVRGHCNPKLLGTVLQRWCVPVGKHPD